MKYIIHTPSAMRLKQEILKRVEEKANANGKAIVTWQIIETDDGEKVLVHTVDQWAEKGGIVLKQVPLRNELQVRFYYWDSCGDRDNNDDMIMLGRFTELLLVHFSYFIDKIAIE